LFNGVMALLAPKFLLRRLGVDPDTNPAALYALRMFGIRTVLIGADLLRSSGEIQSRSLRTAVVIHASDVGAALLAGLPPRGMRMATAISAVNTLLAILAQPRKA
jgi:hypothetical protein